MAAQDSNARAGRRESAQSEGALSRERSPNYPNYAIDIAIENIKSLYRAAGRTPVDPVVAVKHWGHQTVSGASRSRLSALRQYGLLDSERGGKIRVSQRGLTVALRSSDSPEFQEAIRSAVLAPQVFRDLYETKRDVADDEILRHELISERGFSRDGADRAIEVFRANLKFARLLEYSEQRDGTDGVLDDIESEADRGDQGIAYRLAPKGREAASERSLENAVHYRLPLPGGLIADVRLAGGEVTAVALGFLREYLELAERALRFETRSTPEPVAVDSVPPGAGGARRPRGLDGEEISAPNRPPQASIGDPRRGPSI